PADRIRKRQNDGVLALALEAHLDLGNLFGCWPTRERQWLCDYRIRWRARTPLAPKNVDGVLRQRLQLDVLRRQSRLEARDFAGCMVPGIKADGLAFAEC